MMTAAKKQDAQPPKPAVGNDPGQINANTGKVNPATPTATPAPAVATPAATTQTKQEQTLAKLRDAWTARKVDLSKLSVKHDGKYMLINVGEGWPEIKIGPSGGGDIPEVKSFPKFFDAAIVADELLKKQIARTTKAATPATPTVVTVKATVVPDQAKAGDAVTPAQKKKQADAALEQKLQAQA